LLGKPAEEEVTEAESLAAEPGEPCWEYGEVLFLSVGLLKWSSGEAAAAAAAIGGMVGRNRRGAGDMSKAVDNGGAWRPSQALLVLYLLDCTSASGGRLCLRIPAATGDWDDAVARLPAVSGASVGPNSLADPTGEAVAD
jgi:hypothetical protein